MTDYVMGVVIHPGGQSPLIMKSDPGDEMHGIFNLPGGKIEAGETPFQAIRREWCEETGIEITHWTPIILLENPEWRIFVFTAQGPIDGPLYTQEVEEGFVSYFTTPPPDIDPTALWLWHLARDKNKYAIQTISGTEN